MTLKQNMVGPGEVDKDLEPETAEECTKYGKVIKCVIFEVCVHVLDVFVSSRDGPLYKYQASNIVVVSDPIYISYTR